MYNSENPETKTSIHGIDASLARTPLIADRLGQMELMCRKSCPWEKYRGPAVPVEDKVRSMD